MRLLARTLSVAMVSVGLVVGGAASGQALDTWSTVVRCGLGYVCKITTDTTRGAVRHEIQGSPVAYWSTGGFRSSTTNRNTDATAGAWTEGAFTYHTAGSYRPSGRTCGA